MRRSSHEKRPYLVRLQRPYLVRLQLSSSSTPALHSSHFHGIIKQTRKERRIRSLECYSLIATAKKVVTNCACSNGLSSNYFYTIASGRIPLAMNKLTASEMMAVYGLSLMFCGALAYQASGMQSKAMSSIYMGNGGAVLAFLLGFGVRNTDIKKGEPGFAMMMISIHLAFIFPLLFGGVVAWRLRLLWDVPAKAYLKPYLTVIIGMSLLTAAVIYRMKPKKEPKEKAEGAPQEEQSRGSVKEPSPALRKRRADAMQGISEG